MDELPRFDADDLATALERLPEMRIDSLAFGVIRLDAKGDVALYSAAERRLSGYRKETVGREFFAEIAPCMNDEMFRGRIDKARAAGRLDVRFSFVGDFSDRARRLDVRVVAARDGGMWICMKRPGGDA